MLEPSPLPKSKGDTSFWRSLWQQKPNAGSWCTKHPNPSKKPSLVPSVPFRSIPLPFPPFRHVFYINFYIKWGTTFFQQVEKCYIWLWQYRRGLRFCTYLGWNFRFGLWSRGQNVSKWLFFDTNAQIRSIRERLKKKHKTSDSVWSFETPPPPTATSDNFFFFF